MDDMQTTSPASGAAAVPSSAPEPTAPAPAFDDAPIGVFDSGLGGLTAVKALRQILPEEKLIYFGDTARVPRESIVYLGDSARCPYGPRTLQEVDGFVQQIGGWLVDRGVKMVVIACNTATAGR